MQKRAKEIIAKNFPKLMQDNKPQTHRQQATHKRYIVQKKKMQTGKLNKRRIFE